MNTGQLDGVGDGPLCLNLQVTEGEIEIEHNGSVFKLEYAFVDWSPSERFTLRMGQFLTPIGEYNENLHPSFHWSQVSRPAVFTDVVPEVWFDTGAQAYGRLGSGTTELEWSAYAINGLGGTWDPTASKTMRPLRDRPDAEGNAHRIAGSTKRDVRGADIASVEKKKIAASQRASGAQ